MRILTLTGILLLCCMAGAQDSFEALQARYAALESQYWACADQDCKALVEAEIAPVSDELARMDLAQLQADDALIGPLTAKIQRATIVLQAEAYRKWCRTSLWRWMRGYRRPEWCGE